MHSSERQRSAVSLSPSLRASYLPHPLPCDFALGPKSRRNSWTETVLLVLSVDLNPSFYFIPSGSASLR